MVLLFGRSGGFVVRYERWICCLVGAVVLQSGRSSGFVVG